MTTTVTDAAPVLRLPARASAEPAPVQVCHYCIEPFAPTRDPDNSGELWDLDERGNHCCDDCYCPTCLTGHCPDQDCPLAPETADDTDDRDAAAAYGDPDARYDAQVEPCLSDCE